MYFYLFRSSFAAHKTFVSLVFNFVRKTFYLFFNRQVEGFDWLDTVAAFDINPHSFADLTHVAYVSFFVYIHSSLNSFRICNLLCRIQRKTITVAIDIRLSSLFFSINR